jgi:PBSX family phage terminase large subunit
MSISDVLSASTTDYFYGEKGPTHKQVIFRDSPQKYKLFGGGVGGGKTVALCSESIRLSMLFPGNRVFMARHESEAFRKTTLVTLMKQIGDIETIIGRRLLEKGGHNQTKKEINLINSSIIMYGGLGGPEDMDRIKSLEIGAFAVDEASESNLEVVNMLKARLRWRLPSGEYPKFFGLFASNPEPGWLKNTFVLPQQQGIPQADHLFVQSLLRDNPWLPPDYIEQLKRDNPASWVKRYVEGSWDAVEGQIWPDFDYNTHVFPNADSNYEIPIPYDLNYEIFGALDHGQTNPTCLLGFYTDEDGNIFVFNEYYSPGLASSHANRIKGIFDIFKFQDIVADPSMFNKTREKYGDVWSIADEYEEHGIELTRANNDTAAGWNRVGEYLRYDEKHPHPILDKVGSPRLFISQRCKNLIREIPEYIWKKNNSNDSNQQETARKLNDHGCDALRYGIMTRPSPYVEETSSAIHPGSFMWYMQQKEFNKRNKHGYIEN